VTLWSLIGWGTIAGLNASKTRLDSRLGDGRHLVTCDKPLGSDVPGLAELLIVLDAPLSLRVRRHVERHAGLDVATLPFVETDTLSGYEAILTRRARVQVERGDARTPMPDTPPSARRSRAP
jgi:hypothetical protein